MPSNLDDDIRSPLPNPPYYAVIFTSTRANDDPEYEKMATAMIELAAKQPGFLGVESARNPDGLGITVSYWESLDSIEAWRSNSRHKAAQEKGKATWYSSFKIRVCRVEREN